MALSQFDGLLLSRLTDHVTVCLGKLFTISVPTVILLSITVAADVVECGSEPGIMGGTVYYNVRDPHSHPCAGHREVQ